MGNAPAARERHGTDNNDCVVNKTCVASFLFIDVAGTATVHAIAQILLATGIFCYFSVTRSGIPALSKAH